MDKNAIKKYAVWARRELISRVSQRAAYYDITEDGFGDPTADSVLGRVLSAGEKTQRQALIAQIRQKDYRQVMEEVAYTWFNRFIALRFMEVNGYLPSHVRVFTDEENQFKPQILAEAIHMELDGLDLQKVYAFKNANDDDGLFKYMIIVQCNALSSILPGMFQRISDYTELLFPDNLLREGSVLQQMIALIPEEDWKDAVQIIGWLYQYYNAEKKDEVFAALKKNVKITKENIPAATQLFTPDWIVRYMVENSLGRLWVEGHPDTGARFLPTGEEQSAFAAGNRSPEDRKWHYYLEEAEQEPDVQVQLAEIRKEYADITPKQIKCIDPCCGSGHILAYLFDVLMQIYESYGYTTREAVASIVRNNLYGLDIDDRAAQLAYFAVMMKARQYDRRFFSRGIQPHVYAIRESNRIDRYAIDYFCNGDARLKTALGSIITELHDAKEYGSILNVTPVDFSALYVRFDEVQDDVNISRETVLHDLLPLVQVAEAMAQKYDVVVTNPPYMGSSGMGAKLTDFVKKNYPDSKSDLFAVFIEACGKMTRKNGYQAMITQHAWMFLSSLEKLRTKLLQEDTVNMAHLGARAFDEIGGEVVQTTSFVLRNSHIVDYQGTYCRLIAPTSQQGKEDMFLAQENRYTAHQSNFSKIPGSPVAYWASLNLIYSFKEQNLAERGFSYQGIITGDVNHFLRLWYEVVIEDITFGETISETLRNSETYYPYIKGGTYNKWYGNLEYIIKWENDGTGLVRSRTENRNYFFKEGITWALITTTNLSFRWFDTGFLCDVSGSSYFAYDENDLLYILAFLNSPVSTAILNIINPTINLNIKDIMLMPLHISNLQNVSTLTEQCIFTSKIDWDSFETSWDFETHPMIRWSKNLWDVTAIGATMQNYYGCHPQVNSPLELCYLLRKGQANQQFRELKANEEELNRIFIDIYGLQDELTPDVADKDVTVHYVVDTKDDIPASLQGSNYVLTRRDVIVSLISYAVGCMFGRYTIYEDGLFYAGGPWNYGSKVDRLSDSARKNGVEYWIPSALFLPDEDNIIPICDDEYFDDDIVGRFVKFIETVYGSDTLEENLKFIADALGGKGTPRDVIRSYFLDDFYADHCRTYQKRPIYWLFDSGKKNGFKALIYMHRYQPDTIARIRTDYVHEQQSRYRTAIADLESRISSASTAERVKLNKQLKKLQEQDAELRTYEEKIHHLADQMIPIDLDDGVKVNYAKFQDVLGKIK